MTPGVVVTKTTTVSKTATIQSNTPSNTTTTSNPAIASQNKQRMNLESKILGGIFGGLAGLLLIAALCYFIFYYRPQRKNKLQRKLKKNQIKIVDLEKNDQGRSGAIIDQTRIVEEQRKKLLQQLAPRRQEHQRQLHQQQQQQHHHQQRSSILHYDDPQMGPARPIITSQSTQSLPEQASSRISRISAKFSNNNRNSRRPSSNRKLKISKRILNTQSSIEEKTPSH